jgi:hypothetical protein
MCCIILYDTINWEKVYKPILPMESCIEPNACERIGWLKVGIPLSSPILSKSFYDLLINMFLFLETYYPVSREYVFFACNTNQHSRMRAECVSSLSKQRFLLLPNVDHFCTVNRSVSMYFRRMKLIGISPLRSSRRISSFTRLVELLRDKAYIPRTRMFI